MHPVVVRLVIIVAVGCLLLSWAFVRSSPILGGVVQDQIDLLERQSGAQISFDGLAAAGLTGVEIQDVTIRHESIPGIVRIDAVRLYPDISALLGRRIEIGSAQLRGVAVEGQLDVTELVESVFNGGTGDAAAQATSQPSFSCASLRRIPRTIAIEDGVLNLTDTSDAVPLPQIGLTRAVLGLDCQQAGLVVRLRGTMHVSNIPAVLDVAVGPNRSAEIGVLFSSPIEVTPYVSPFAPLPAGAEIEVMGLTSNLQDSATVTGLLARSFNAPIPEVEQWRMDGLGADQLSLTMENGSVTVDLQDGHVQMLGILDSPTIAVESAHVWLDTNLHNPDGWVVLGGGARGSLAIDISRSRYDGSTTITAAAESYDLSELIPLIPYQDSIRLESGRMNGNIALVFTHDTEQFWIDTDVALADGSVMAPLVASRPLTDIEMTTAVQLTVDLGRSNLSIDGATISLGAVPFEVAVDLDWSDSAGGLLGRIGADGVSAQALHEALPGGLAPSLEDAELVGQLSASVDLDLSFTQPETSVVNLDLDLADVQVRRFGPRARVDQLTGPFAILGGHDPADQRMFGPLAEGWVPLAEVGPHLAAALSSAEDGRFWDHDGFDEAAIMSSLEENLRQGRIVRGGSTISQQVARSLFLGQERTLGRKFEEAVLTWQLEQLVSKERIMELYVNAVHWGPGIYGVREAAEAYFSTTPGNLTLLETAFLASILSNPNVYGTQYARDQLAASRQEKICNILLNMHHDGEITRTDHQQACAAASEGRISDAPLPTHLVPLDAPPAPTLSAHLQ